MATAEKNGTNQNPQPPAERLIDRLKKALDAVRDTIERSLPDEMKPHIDRIIQRAVLTFKMGSEELQKCTIGSFVECVVEAASVGLMIDGKLAYAVPYNCKVKVNGRDTWEMRAKFMASYIGLYMIAKRSGQIKHAAAELVYEADHFDIYRQGPRQFLEHRPPTFGQDRGSLLGGYAVVEFPDGGWAYTTMTISEIDDIKNRSKASSRGPWVTDTAEMQRKTLLRRSLKLHCSDPMFIKAEQYEDAEYDGEAVAVSSAAPKASRSDLTERFAGLPAPRQRTQFEQDLDAGPQYQEGETVDARQHADAEQTYQHRAPDTQGDEPPADDHDFRTLLKELDGHLKGAPDLKTIDNSRAWARGRLSRTLTEDERMEIDMACDQARDAKKAGRGEASNKTQGSLMAKSPNVGQ